MNIRKVRLSGFMLQDATYEFPETGVVVVTGPNGVGKSSIVEGVSYGLWGETLRKNDPWTRKDGVTYIETDVLSVERKRKGRNVLVSYEAGDRKGVDLNPTKAKAVLAPLAVPWDVWRRACAFSSSDVAHFSLASDGEQKRLIESVLGLGVFDPALRACRDDLSVATGVRAVARSELGGLVERIEGLEKRIEDNKGWSGDPPGDARIAKVAARLDRLKELAEKLRADRLVAHAALRNADAKQGEARAQLAEIRRRLDVLRADKCPTCEQAIPPTLRSNAEAMVEAFKKDLQRSNRDEAEQVLEDLNEEAADLQEQMEAVRRLLHDLQASQDRFEKVRKTLTDCEAALREGLAKRDEQTKALKDLDKRIAVLEASERVLGLKGVRANVLGNALSGLDAVANAWMARIAGPDVRVRLESVDKASGTSFALVVDGIGGGSYKGASGGQRRRVDVAFLFALSEMAAAARGASPGTLFVDEVFDALDDEGVVAVSAAMQEIAQDRCVVVITHNKALVHALQPVRRWDLAPSGNT